LPTLAQLRVLIVDDVEMNRRVLTGQLGALGIAAGSVIDGFQAIVELERAWHQGRPFDLVIIDQRMPALSGDELARRIRDMPEIAETKLLLASSGGTHALPPGALAMLDAILIKPIREQSLLDAFVRLFGSAATPPGPTAVVFEIKQAATRALRVLVAEDNRINQQLAAVMLRHVGHKVDVVENGQEAVEAVRTGIYDVVLMDVQMPLLDGMQATERIRALPPPANRVTIIAVTAHAMAGAREEYLAAGMDDYLSKPIEPGILFGKLAAVSAGDGASTTTDNPEVMRDAVLDHAHLVSLAMHLPAENVRQLLSLFLDQIEAQIVTLKALSAGGDLPALACEAHTLAGTSGNVGALRLSGLARGIEAASKDADAERVAQLARGLDRVAKEAAAGLRHWLEAGGSTGTDPRARRSPLGSRSARQKAAARV
jgi:CheY-like chemotaxis protein